MEERSRFRNHNEHQNDTMNAMPDTLAHSHTKTHQRPVNPCSIDVSRGASQLGIRSRVLIDEELRDAYAEIDPALGQNAIGTVLSVLACHLAMGQGGLSDDRITVCLTRRADDRMVEVDLGIHRHRHAGHECLSLRHVADRQAGEQGGENICE